jgi:transposase-like protein
MARNKVQFQKGLSEPDFERLYGSEEACRAALFEWRWPQGFECPQCGDNKHCVLEARGLYQCNGCRHQTSLTAGTIFASTKLPLTTWFRAIYHMTQTKQGISSIELGRRLGVTQTTAWKIKNKLAQVMMERDAGKKLRGRVEIDDAYLGGEQGGGKRGRGSPGKTPIIAAVETTPDGKPVRLALRRVKAFSKARVKDLARQILEAGTMVVSDGLGCFRGVTDAGCIHVVVAAAEHGHSEKLACFRWVNTTLANIKNSITGTYRAVREKHAQRTLAEFECRFNRRFDLAAIIPRLCYVAMRTPPMPYRLLKLAEDGA